MWIIAGMVCCAHEIEKRGAGESTTNTVVGEQNNPNSKTPDQVGIDGEPSASDIGWGSAVPESVPFRL
jgi:hypothetical protein